MRTLRAAQLVTALVLLVLAIAPCMSFAAASSAPARIPVVAAENEYGNVASQVGGRFVAVSSIEDNPNTDPHTFEASPRVAEEVASARLVIENGLGYDSFVDKIEQAAPNSRRKTIDVQRLLRLASSTSNPHLWYKPTTMPAVAKAIAAALSRIDPGERGYFSRRAEVFIASLKPWTSELASLRRRFARAGVAVTEPVGDYLLQAAGLDIKTPFSLQADVMNGVDPSPQDVATEERLFSSHEVKVFVYNQQVTDSLTAQFLADARAAHIPVVGVYETMPTPGYTYQSWMLAEAKAIERALAQHRSTTRL